MISRKVIRVAVACATILVAACGEDATPPLAPVGGLEAAKPPNDSLVSCYLNSVKLAMLPFRGIAWPTVLDRLTLPLRSGLNSTAWPGPVALAPG
jgi:hypothetical protein